MRQRIALFVLGIVLLAAASSCKTRERCPAYGQHAPAAAHRPA